MNHPPTPQPVELSEEEASVLRELKFSLWGEELQTRWRMTASDVGKKMSPLIIRGLVVKEKMIVSKKYKRTIAGRAALVAHEAKEKGNAE